MLRLTRIDEGACYVTETTNLYVALSMLVNSSKLFLGSEIVKNLDKEKSLSLEMNDYYIMSNNLTTTQIHFTLLEGTWTGEGCGGNGRTTPAQAG